MGENITMSVIVPIYNAEAYLERAVNSVLSQQHDWIEIILINDGSTDKSGQICDQFSKNKNVKVIHKANGGVSTARNAGLNIASGKYISFLDADDYVDEVLYSRIRDILLNNNVDLLDYGIKYVSQNGEYLEVHHKIAKNKPHDLKYIHEKIIPPIINICKDDDNFIFSYAWNKIFKRETIEKYNIRFDEERRTWEDRIFIAEYLKYCNTFYSIEECLYNYVNVENSLSRRYDPGYLKIIVSSYHTYKKLYEDEYNFNTDYVNDYWYISIDNMIASQLKLYGEKKEVKENIITILNDPIVISWFEKRIPSNSFEIKLNKLIKNHDYNSIFKLYQKRNRNSLIKERITFFENKIKRIIKKVLKRSKYEQ